MPDRLVWDVPNARLAVENLSDGQLATAIANGTRQDPAIGGLLLIDGKGSAAPPFTMSATPGDDGLAVAFDAGGGAAGATKVTYLFNGPEGLEQTQRVSPASFDFTQDFDVPGQVTVTAINDFGQQWRQVLTLATVPPTITTLTPSTAAETAGVVEVALVGTALTPGVRVFFNNVEVEEVDRTSFTALTFEIDLDGMAPGVKQVRVETENGVSANKAFTVT